MKTGVLAAHWLQMLQTFSIGSAFLASKLSKQGS